MPRTAPRLSVLIAGLLVASSVPTIAQDDAADTDAARDTSLELTDDGGAPTAGRYTDRSLAVELGFTLDDGWADGWAAPPYGVVLASDAGGLLFIADIDDGWLFERPCQVEDDDPFLDEHVDIELTPEAVIRHWEANPLLENEGMVPMTVAGTEGYMLDVHADMTGLGRRCVDPEVPLWGEVLGDEEGMFSLRDDSRARIVLFEADGKIVAVVLEGVGREAFASALELGMPVVESLSLPSIEAPAE